MTCDLCFVPAVLCRHFVLYVGMFINAFHFAVSSLLSVTLTDHRRVTCVSNAMAYC